MLISTESAQRGPLNILEVRGAPSKPFSGGLVKYMKLEVA